MKKLKLLAVLMAIIMTTNVHAALQSRPGVDAKKSTISSDFFKLIREMEAENGALALNATFAENSITNEYEETSSSNNIDAHMCKNTEWGTVAMLSASDYGAGNGKVKANYNDTTKTYDVTASTTGNMTGVFGLYSGAAGTEYTAGGILSSMSDSATRYLKYASIRYVDSYANGTDQYDYLRYIPGDGTYETLTFDTYSYRFLFVTSSSYIFYRGGLFSFGVRPNGSSFGGVGGGHSAIGSRACLWVGEGL